MPVRLIVNRIKIVEVNHELAFYICGLCYFDVFSLKLENSSKHMKAMLVELPRDTKKMYRTRFTLFWSLNRPSLNLPE